MKKLLSLLLALSMVLSLAACGGSRTEETDQTEEALSETSEVADTSDTPDASEISEETEEETAPDWTSVNPLTGEPSETDYSDTRPIAVMLNNIEQALPQSGNSQADVLYEVPEEGGITRIMALYQDVSGVGTLGSIRSTRPYYVRLALASDAILVHAGGSGAAYNLIKEFMEDYDFVDLDFLSKGTRTADIFYRDQSRLSAGYSSEHTLFTNSDSIEEYIEEHQDEMKLDHRKHFRRTHTFAEDGTPAYGETADSIDVSFSGYKGTTFDYNEETGTYDVSEFGSAYMDQAAGEQVTVENVVVIQTDIEQLNDAKHHVAVYLTGTGSGYYACNGKVEPITWTKEKARYTYTFTDENGDEVPLGIGKTFVCIVDKSRDITIDGVVQETPDDAGDSGDLADSEALDDEDAE